MAFWRMGSGFTSQSNIDKLLNTSDHSLADLLDEPDLLQELMVPNTKLTEYLREPETLSELVKFVLRLDSIEQHEQRSDAQEPSEQKQVSSDSPDKESEDTENGLKEKEKSASSADGPNDADSQNVEEIPKISVNAVKEESEKLEDEEDEHEPTVSEVQLDDLEDDTNDLKLSEDSDSSDEDERSDKPGNPSTLIQDVDNIHIHGDEMGDTHDDSDNSDPDETQNQEDDEDDEEKKIRRLGLAATEVLSADVWSITEAFIESFELLDELWKVLDRKEPLDVNFSSCFAKINEHFLDKKTSDMIDFIKSQTHLVDRFLNHMDDTPLIDFLLKVISTDKPNSSTGIIDLLQEQKLIPNILEFLAPNVANSVQSAAAEFVKAFITLSANSNTDNSTIGPNELSRELVSEKCVRRLVELMLEGGSGLANGVNIVIEIIRKNNSDYDYMPVLYMTLESHPPSDRDTIYLGTLVKVFAENIPKFDKILSATHTERLETSFGEIEPLGFERFRVCELIAELLHCSNMGLLNDRRGEAIVRERDIERERMRKLAAREENDTADVDDNAMDVNSEKGSKSERGDDEEGNTGSSLPRSNEESLGNEQPDWDTSQSSVVQPGDEMNEIPDAASLRENPVVGDQLKIALADNNAITTILQMFFTFPWNNFLHNVVFDLVQQVLNGSMEVGYNRFLAIDLFGKGKLCEIICEQTVRCEQYEKEHHTRLGCMGHLTLISEEVVKFNALHSPETISPIVMEAVSKPEWNDYVNQTLVRTREQYNTVLGGHKPEDLEIERNPNVITLGQGEDQPQYGDEDDDEAMATALGDKPKEESIRLDMDYKDHSSDEEEGSRRMDLDSTSGQFAHYMSQQIAGSGHFGSSDEDEDEDEWDGDKSLASNDRTYRHAYDSNLSSSTLANRRNADDEQGDVNADDDEYANNEEDEDLGLVRSKSHEH